MDYQPALFIRIIGADEDATSLLDDVKSETWTRRAEHAVLRLEDGRRILVRGGAMGIEFVVGFDGRPQVSVEGKIASVAELIWHTHPQATGPSDFDCRVLELLHQESSVVHEINGIPGGTLFFRKGDSRGARS
jgi:hypothetical protein